MDAEIIGLMEVENNGFVGADRNCCHTPTIKFIGIIMNSKHLSVEYCVYILSQSNANVFVSPTNNMTRTIDCNLLLNLFGNHDTTKLIDISKTAYKMKDVADNLGKDKE
eukprot:6174574-Ditylum_brightwellii.AAC.1